LATALTHAAMSPASRDRAGAVDPAVSAPVRCDLAHIFARPS